MNISRPNWRFASAQCSYCAEGELIFSTCPSCGLVVVVCAECSTVYDLEEKRVGREVGDLTGDTLCHNCASSRHNDFHLSTDEEIRNRGFVFGEYK